MKKTSEEKIYHMNYLCSELDALYHRASKQLGISDSVSLILYTIYTVGEGCLLSDVYKNSGISRQTVNSGIRKLEAEGILYLEPYNGKSKKIVLTEKGKEHMQQTAAVIFRAEVAAFDTWTEEEINAYIQLSEKYVDSLRDQIEKI